jgi:hypothetical protein
MDAVQTKTTTTRVPSRFRSPLDSNYRCVVDQIKRCLILKASTDKRLEELLAQLIDRGYNLDVKDHEQRWPLHRAADCGNDAAVIRLVSARPDLVAKKDKYGFTPLHMAISKTISENPENDRRAPFRMMIEKLVSALDENKHESDIKADDRKTPWDYIRKDKHEWILELKDAPRMFNGARATQVETLDEIVKDIGDIEADACMKLDATLAQFYIANDGSTDYLDIQRPWVHGAIYDKRYGVEKLFDRNLRLDEDKRATCRWIHLPANNVSPQRLS